MRGIEFVTYGDQCPWNGFARGEARGAAEALGVPYEETDILEYSKRSDPKAPVIVTPFAIVIDGAIPFCSPVPARYLVDFYRSDRKMPDSLPDLERLPEGVPESIQTLAPDTADDDVAVCVNGERSANAKARWLGERRPFGVVSYSGGNPVAMAEAVPAGDCPYRLPIAGDRSRADAFLLCLYSNAPPLDYRRATLDALVARLRPEGFRSLYAFSGRNHPYPNGNLEAFGDYGFKPLGVATRIFLHGLGMDDAVLCRLDLE